MMKDYSYSGYLKIVCISAIMMCLSGTKAFAQWCGSIDGQTSFNQMSKTATTQNLINSDEVLAINIYFNVLNSGSTSDVTEQQCRDAVADLNSYFADANIAFRFNGYRNRYNQPLANVSSNADFNNLRNINTNTQNLQVFLINSYGGGSGGRAELPGTYMCLTKDYLDTRVFAHELGHNFNLYHTHHGGPFEPDPNIPAENINGSNCATAGDLVCDTPADPYLGGNVNSLTCAYTGDPSYNPDTENIMSYTLPQCMESFTAGQIERMRDGLVTITDLASFQIDANLLARPAVSISRDNYTRRYAFDGCYEISYWEVDHLTFQKGFNYSIDVTINYFGSSQTNTYTFGPSQTPVIDANENYSYTATIIDYTGVQYSASGSAGYVSYIDCPIYFPMLSMESESIKSGKGKSIPPGMYMVPIKDEKQEKVIEKVKVVIQGNK